MTTIIRKIVSGPKARFVDKELNADLDLVYVTDRLIIMGWPASSVEALYRNPRKDVRRFLDTKHKNKYRIYNLCPCSENSYDADEFYGNVSRYPFPDHHPPPLSLIPMLVADITAWLGQDAENVAVIHCKAGKGRSGTMACCYLLSLPNLPSPPQDPRNLGVSQKVHKAAQREKNRAAQRSLSPAAPRLPAPPHQLLSSASTSQLPPSPLTEQMARLNVPAEPKDAMVRQVQSHDKLAPPPGDLNVRDPSSLSVTRGTGSITPLPMSEDELRGYYNADKISERLQSVFEMHSARRLRHPKEKAQKVASTPESIPGNHGVRNSKSKSMDVRRDEFASLGSLSSPSRPTKSTRMRSLSNVFGRKSSAQLRKQYWDEEKFQDQNESSLASRRNDRLRSLGAAPAGKSVGDLTSGSKYTPRPSASEWRSSSYGSNSRACVSTPYMNVDKHDNQGKLSTSVANNNGHLRIDFVASPKLDSDVSTPLAHPYNDDPFFVHPKPVSHTPPVDVTDTKRAADPSASRFTLLSQDMGSDAEDLEGEEAKESLPQWAVSIPSQRRFVGYWARILASRDPRTTINGTTPLCPKRTVRITRITVDRQLASGGKKRDTDTSKMPDSLSIQFGRYDPSFEDRVVKWETTARRRARAFGVVDPSAPTPDFPVSKDNGDLHGESDELVEKIQREKDEQCWNHVANQNSRGREGYEQKLAQHGNEMGVGCWGINVIGEQERIRNFAWQGSFDETAEGNERKGEASIDYFATVQEKVKSKITKQNRKGPAESSADVAQDQWKESKSMDVQRNGRSSVDLLRSFAFGEEGAANSPTPPTIIRHTFTPGQTATTQYGTLGLPTWAKNALERNHQRPARGQPEVPQRRESLLPFESDPSSHDTSPNGSVLWPRTPRNGAAVHQMSPPTSVESLGSVEAGSHTDNEEGIVIDADRAVMLKVLLGRSGASHSRLPDIASCGYVWFVPSFETPPAMTPNGRTPHYSDQVGPLPGQHVTCTFGPGEIDFRKGKKPAKLLGGEVRRITVEWDWLETGIDMNEEQHI